MLHDIPRKNNFDSRIGLEECLVHNPLMEVLKRDPTVPYDTIQTSNHAGNGEVAHVIRH